MYTTRLRTRNIGNLSISSETIYNWGIINDNASNPRKVSTSTFNLLYATEETYDNVTPMFKKRSARGEVILNDYLNRRVTPYEEVVPFMNHFYDSEDAETHGGFQDTGTITTMRMNQGGPGYLTQEPSYDLYGSEAVINASANTDEAKATLLVTLAEFRKTMGILHDSVAAVDRLQSSFSDAVRRRGFNPRWSAARKKRWRLKVGKQAVKAVSQAWLTYRYGVRPIVFDVRNLIEAATSKPNLRFTAIGKSYASSSYNESQVNTTAFGSMDVQIDLARKVRDDYVCGIVCEIPNPFFGYVNHWGIDDIASTVWELVPYSFVIDWFSGIGRLISSIDSKIGVIEKGRWLKRSRTIVDTMDLNLVDSYNNSNAYRVVYGTGKRSLVTQEKQRWTRLSDFPSFSPGGILFNEDVKLDTSKIADLLALIAARTL